MDSNAFRGIGEAMVAMFWICLVALPLAVWKLIDIIIFVVRHVKIGIH